MGGLELAGDERKNLVPVEWVSAATTALVARPECHGETYHLTNPRPVTVQGMQDVIVQALSELDWDKITPGANSLVNADFVAGFREQMGIYQSYWSDDPRFDSSHTEAALPQLPCPEITRDVMLQLIRFALKTNFGWPREAPVVPAFDVGQWLGKWLSARPSQPTGGNVRYVSLAVSGQGGGQWHLLSDQGRLVGVGVGVQNGSSPTCYMTSATLARMARGELKLEDSINSGRLVVAGNSVHPSELARLLGDLMSDDRAPNR